MLKQQPIHILMIYIGTYCIYYCIVFYVRGFIIHDNWTYNVPRRIDFSLKMFLGQSVTFFYPSSYYLTWEYFLSKCDTENSIWNTKILTWLKFVKWLYFFLIHNPLSSLYNIGNNLSCHGAAFHIVFGVEKRAFCFTKFQ